jgi:hypothetical protein
MPEDAFEGILREVWRVASPGAVMTYRNLLVFRERPLALQSMIRPDRLLAESLHASDRSFIYRNYIALCIVLMLFLLGVYRGIRRSDPPPVRRESDKKGLIPFSSLGRM